MKKNRRARLRRRTFVNSPTADELKALLKNATHCALCCHEFSSEEQKSTDHIVPLSKGGKHTFENIQVAHKSCNQKKGDKFYSGYKGGQMFIISPSPLNRTRR